tara:strand:+ start:10267 stop:10926 length:660 start_codon:yes stop_codon:yes gene_type:complete
MEPLTLFGLGTNIMFSLGIVFAIVFIIFYMRQRFSEYNHKLNSMFQLISAMADELNLLKNSDNSQKPFVEKENELLNSKNIQDTNNELLKLVVSDEEYSDDSDDSDSDDDSEENTDTVEYNNVVLEGTNNTLVINDDLEQVVVEEVTNDIKNAVVNDKDNIKLIEISSGNVEENLNNEELDINKLTVKQLRDLVTKKGLSFEQSAKKKDLIKLLEENNN